MGPFVFSCRINEIRSSLFSIPVPPHERSVNVSSYPLLRLYSIITMPTAPCSLRSCFLQHFNNTWVLHVFLHILRGSYSFSLVNLVCGSDVYRISFSDPQAEDSYIIFSTVTQV